MDTEKFMTGIADLMKECGVERICFSPGTWNNRKNLNDEMMSVMDKKENWVKTICAPDFEDICEFDRFNFELSEKEFRALAKIKP